MITVATMSQLCHFILLYFGYSASSAQPLDASESKAMNPIENHERKLSGIKI